MALPNLLPFTGDWPSYEEDLYQIYLADIVNARLRFKGLPIRWIAYLISHADTDADISWWENQRGRNTHVVIWHEHENFAVILAKRNEFFLLKSAYCAESHRRKMFVKERECFWLSHKG